MLSAAEIWLAGAARLQTARLRANDTKTEIIAPVSKPLIPSCAKNHCAHFRVEVKKNVTSTTIQFLYHKGRGKLFMVRWHYQSMTMDSQGTLAHQEN